MVKTFTTTLNKLVCQLSCCTQDAFVFNCVEDIIIQQNI